jgi:hypothetical protein
VECGGLNVSKITAMPASLPPLAPVSSVLPVSSRCRDLMKVLDEIFDIIDHIQRSANQSR